MAGLQAWSAERGAALTQLQAAGQALWRAPQWRAARVALVLLVLIQIVGLNLWAWRDRAALADKRAAISGVLMQSFPKTQVVVDPQAQMTQAVAKLRAGSGALSPADLETQLAQLPSGAPLLQIDFQNNALKVLP